MLYRQTYLEKSTTLADSGERVIDINIVDPITALLLQFSATNGTSGNRANLLASNITNIEVIDGSDVFYSLDGSEALAYTAYWQRCLPADLVSETPAAIQTVTYLVPFGRFLGDTYHSFDPKRFVNPQIRVRWNLSTVRAVGVDSFAPSSGELTVIALVMEGAPAASSFLMTKQHYTSTGAASGVDYIDLPADATYRNLLLRAYKAGSAVSTVISHLKLNVEAGRYVPIDSDISDLLAYLALEQGHFAYRHLLYAKNSDTASFIVKDKESVGIGSLATNDLVVAYNNSGIGQGALSLYTAGAAQATNVALGASVSGYAPLGCILLPFGKPNDEADWFPAPSFRSIRLELTQGAADATVAVCLQQERRY